MEWIEDEPTWLGLPASANELIGREAFERLQSSPVIVGVDEVGEMASQFLVVLVMEPLDRRLFDGSVHPLDLAVRPGMHRLCRAVIDVGPGACVFEGVTTESLAIGDRQFDFWHGRSSCARRREVGCVVGQHGVDLVRDRLDEAA